MGKEGEEWVQGFYLGGEGDENVLKLDYSDACRTVNILKTSEFCGGVGMVAECAVLCRSD